MAHRSAFETINILIILNKRNLITVEKMEKLLEQIDLICRKITNLKKSLNNI